MTIYRYYSDDWRCDNCNPDRSFGSRNALDQHLRDSLRHNWCFTCDEDFDSFPALREHRQDAHNACVLCDEEFYWASDRDDHEEEEHHKCEIDECGRVFWDKDDLDSHQLATHFYCRPCGHFFQSPQNLDAHLRSSAHRERDVFCPLPDCDKAFVSQSALALHWDQGYCPGGGTRVTVNRYLMANDTDRFFTDPQNRNRMYHCPPQGCGARFGSFSALAQHIESGSCNVKQFAVVQRQLNKYTCKSRMLQL